MKLALRDLWTAEGTVDRGPYLTWGVLLFAVKHNLDRVVVSAVFGKKFHPLNYFYLEELVHKTPSSQDQVMLATLLVMALPFIWTGVVLTLRRLASAGLPPALIALFFLPVLNLVFFVFMAAVPASSASLEGAGSPPPEAPAADAATLAAAAAAAAGEEGSPEDDPPSPDEAKKDPAEAAGREHKDRALPAPAPTWLDRVIPRSRLGSAAAACFVTAPVGIGGALLATLIFEAYGMSLFVALPFCLGFTAALLHGYHEERSLRESFAVAALSVILVGAGLLAFAIEGVICLAMAFPIAFVLAVFGGGVGWLVHRHGLRRHQLPAGVAALVLASPLLMGAEWAGGHAAPSFPRSTALVVDAPPEVVWENVIRFADLPPPDEWIFRAGIAYPIRARIEGEGVGAIRHCEFSTGAFVEPIEVWDAPRELRFSVEQSPHPMAEWSPYPMVHPPHLEDFMVSEGGRFLLTPLPDGRTRLEGTTWYKHHMWPTAYWTLITDHIIEAIHTRVLRHIRDASQDARRASPTRES